VPKTREQIAYEIGISVTTLWRKMRDNKLSIPKGLVFPDSEEKIYALFKLLPPIKERNEKHIISHKAVLCLCLFC